MVEAIPPPPLVQVVAPVWPARILVSTHVPKLVPPVKPVRLSEVQLCVRSASLVRGCCGP